MANPQIENGYTKIANEIMDALCRMRIPGEERQILDCIFRKTYGWNKCEDAISLSQFVDMTSMKKPNIIRAINGLLSKKIITVIEKDNKPAKVYKFNKDHSQWQSLSKKITNVIKKDNSSLSKMIPTKEITSKEKKEIYPQDFLNFYEAYPKKADKAFAFKTWQKVRGRLPPLQMLLGAIRKQIEWRKSAGAGEFRPEWKNPASWLNKGSWDDEITYESEKRKQQAKPNKRYDPDEEARQINENWQREHAAPLLRTADEIHG
jgi:phage replication O-like protein O